jgi:hypothetical protein
MPRTNRPRRSSSCSRRSRHAARRRTMHTSRADLRQQRANREHAVGIGVAPTRCHAGISATMSRECERDVAVHASIVQPMRQLGDRGRVRNCSISHREALRPARREGLQFAAVQRSAKSRRRVCRRIRPGQPASTLDARRGGRVESTLDERDGDQQICRDGWCRRIDRRTCIVECGSGGKCRHRGGEPKCEIDFGPYR